MELMPSSPYWQQCGTISNGSCSYHALAEVFVRLIRHQPEFINPQLFAADNAIFAPVQDFLRISLDLGQEPFTREVLQEKLRTQEARHLEYIAEKVAPAMLILALSQFRTVIGPLRERYQTLFQQCVERDSWSAALMDECFNSVTTQSDHLDIALPEDAEKDLRQDYKNYIQLNVTSENLVNIEVISTLAQSYPFIGDFLRSTEPRLTPGQAHEFTQRILNGFLPSEYADSGLMLNIIKVLMTPSRKENGVNGDHTFTYPCALVSAEQLDRDNDLRHEYYPYAIYQVQGVAHFEYGLSQYARDRFHETPSVRPIICQSLSQIQPSHRKGLSQEKFRKKIRDQMSRPQQPNTVINTHAIFSIYDWESWVGLLFFLGMLTISCTITLAIVWATISVVLNFPLIVCSVLIGAVGASFMNERTSEHARYQQRQAGPDDLNELIKGTQKEVPATSRVNQNLSSAVIEKDPATPSQQKKALQEGDPTPQSDEQVRETISSLLENIVNQIEKPVVMSYPNDAQRAVLTQPVNIKNHR